MQVPADLKYSEDHEWIKVDGDIAIIGITDYAQGELGDVVFVELPDVGADVTKGDPFGTIEAVKAVSDLFAPANGKVVEINDPQILKNVRFHSIEINRKRAFSLAQNFVNQDLD